MKNSAASFDDVIANVQKCLALNKTDCAVAKRLGIGASAYGARKKNGSIPYKELIELAITEGLDLNQFFYGPPPGADLPIRLNAAAAAPALNAAPTPSAPTPPHALPPVHLAMRESALRMLSAALHTLETLHDHEKQGLPNGTQD